MKILIDVEILNDADVEERFVDEFKEKIVQDISEVFPRGRGQLRALLSEIKEVN